MKKLYYNNEILKIFLSIDPIKKILIMTMQEKLFLKIFLDNYKEYIFSNPNDINFIYNYKIKIYNYI